MIEHSEGSKHHGIGISIHYNPYRDKVRAKQYRVGRMGGGRQEGKFMPKYSLKSKQRISTCHKVIT